MTTTIKGYLTVAEAAKKLKVSTSQVTRYIKAGSLKAAKVGSVWMIRKNDVESFTRRPVGNPDWLKKK